MIETLPEGIGAALEREIRTGWELEKAATYARQGKLGQYNSQTHRSIDGLGQCVANIDATSYFSWIGKEGSECWGDKGFMDSYLRDNPQARVKSVGTKIQVGHR